MAVDLSISGLSQAIGKAAADARTESPKRLDLKANNTTETASAADISGAAAAAKRGTEKAARALSDVASILNIADAATNDVKNLVAKAASVSLAVQAEVDPNKKAQLAAEGSSILAEVSRVVSAAEYNNAPVVGAGAIPTTIDLSGASADSSAVYAVTIPNVDITLKGLGLDQLDAGQFEANPASSYDALNSAANQLNDTSASIELARKSAQQVSSAYGAKLAAAFSEDGGISAESLAEKISMSLNTSLGRYQKDLMPVNVADLLSAPPQRSSPPSSIKITTENDNDEPDSSAPNS